MATRYFRSKSTRSSDGLRMTSMVPRPYLSAVAVLFALHRDDQLTFTFDLEVAAFAQDRPQVVDVTGLAFGGDDGVLGLPAHPAPLAQPFGEGAVKTGGERGEGGALGVCERHGASAASGIRVRA
jgi:hypothetical protein